MSYEATHQIEFGSSHIALKENEVISCTLFIGIDRFCLMINGSPLPESRGIGILTNERASQLNANNTHFMNTHGLHDQNYYTTAYDFALIMKEGIKIPSLDFLPTYYEIQPTASQLMKFVTYMVRIVLY